MPKPYPAPGGRHYAIQDQPPPADTSFVTRKFLNIRYACLSPTEMLDNHLPEIGEVPFPVILQIHGGAFIVCDKADLQILPASRISPRMLSREQFCL